MQDNLGEIQRSELTEDHVTYTMSGILVVLIYELNAPKGKRLSSSLGS